MRAVRIVQIREPLVGAEVPIPEIGPSEVLIRVAAAGICHSDAHYRAGISKIDNLPMTLLIDRNGIVRYVLRDYSAKSDDLYLQQLRTLLNE